MAGEYTPNTKGMVSESQVTASAQRLVDGATNPQQLQALLDEQKKAVARAAQDGLTVWQKLNPKNWPTKVKVAVSAAIGAALVASGLSQEIVGPILRIIFGA